MRLVLLAVIALPTLACDNPSGPDAVVGAPFHLKAGETATIPDGARLRFDALRSDSRCPIDAICISAGDAIIAVTLMRGSGSESRELHTMPAQSQLSYSRYTIKLTELQPYPRSDRPARPDDYVATFVVSTS
jgi:hypothetical protein